MYGGLLLVNGSTFKKIAMIAHWSLICPHTPVIKLVIIIWFWEFDPPFSFKDKIVVWHDHLVQN